MDFKTLCQFFEKVKYQKTPKDKAKIVIDFFTQCRQDYSQDSMFSILRLIVPKMDRVRQSYNMKESKISRVLIKMLALPNGHDQNVLSKSYLMSGQASDFGDVVYSVIRKFLSNCKTILNINELNVCLDEMAERNNETEAEEILLKLFKKCSAEDCRWIIRIILKDLKLGIDSNRILNCYHKDGASYFSQNTNLRKVSETLYDQNVNIHELDIQVFEQFHPMLSKRIDGVSFKKEFQDSKLYYSENKFDGERFQLHMADEKFKYFSRNGFDFTDIYGSSYNDGIFTPLIKGLFQPFVKQVILDGEMMLWNKYTKKYGSKGMKYDVKKLKDNHNYQPCFCVYDVILLNDIILTNKPLKERVGILRKIFKSLKHGTLVISEIKEVQNYQEIINELNIAVGREEEGIIVKDPNSIYKYSDRNSGWFKMKLEFFQDTMNDLDLILMGGMYASSTSDRLNSFIVGIRSGNTDSGEPLYLSLGKVSSGLNDEELDFLNDKIKSDGKKFDGQHSESLSFGKEVPSCYIEPEKSVIFVVRATELIRSTDHSYKTPYTLRFPRILKIRTDKNVTECLSINELLSLCDKNKPVIKLNKRSIQLEEIMQIKSRNVKKRKIEVTTFTDNRKISDLLEGFKMYVINDNENQSMDDLTALVQKAGATISYKLDNSVDVALFGKYNQKVQQLTSKRNSFDVVDVKWLNRVLQEGDLVSYDTLEVFGVGTRINNSLAEDLDRYGDSFTQEASTESLKHCFRIMNQLNEVPNFIDFLEVNYSNRFKNYVAYFDKYENINNPNSNTIYESLLDELEFQYYRGEISYFISPETNLIIFKEGLHRRDILKDYLRSVNRSDIEIRSSSFINQHLSIDN